MTFLPTLLAAGGPIVATGPLDPSPRNITLLIVWVCVALLFSFLCSIWEAVLLSVTGGFVASEKDKGKAYARRLEGIKASIDRPLAGILTLNTIAHTVGASQAGAYAAKIFNSFWVGIFTAIFTIIILLGSEIIPKTIGATFWRKLAPFTTRSVRILTLILTPILIPCEWITRMIGGGHSHSISREEYAAMANVVTASGNIDANEGTIIQNLFNLRSTPVKDVMTPRTVIFRCQQDMTVGEYVEKHCNSPFSRIPLWIDKSDDLDHFVLKHDLLLAMAQGKEKATLKDFQRELLSISEEKTIYSLFQQLIDDNQHVAAVCDSFGAVVGLVSLEDVVETLLGLEIVDEGDRSVDMREKARDLWEKRAKERGIDLDNVT